MDEMLNNTASLMAIFNMRLVDRQSRLPFYCGTYTLLATGSTNCTVNYVWRTTCEILTDSEPFFCRIRHNRVYLHHKIVTRIAFFPTALITPRSQINKVCFDCIRVRPSQLLFQVLFPFVGYHNPVWEDFPCRVRLC